VNTARTAIETIAKAAPDAESDPYAYADSVEHREGIAAFLAKREPQF
ncbi:MAG: enoyl-CoA hydratase/isomerase family protein, partial [Rhodoferax sp.]